MSRPSEKIVFFCYVIKCFFILLVIYGCSNVKTTEKEQYYLKFHIQDTITIPVVKNQRIIAEKPKIIESDSGCFLTFIDTWHSDLVFYSLEKKAVTRRINLKFKEREFIQDFYYINDDSIFIAFSPTYLNDYHDTCIILTNSSKEIISTFSFEGIPVKSTNNNSDTIRFSDWLSYSNYTYFPLHYFKQRNFLVYSLLNMKHYPCDTFIHNNNYYQLGLLNTESTRPNLPLKIRFPCEGKEGLFFEFAYQLNRGMILGDSILIAGFGADNLLQKFNFETQNYTTYTPDFKLPGVIPVSNSISEAKEVYKTHSEYLDIGFVNSKNHFFRIAKVGIGDSTDILRQHYPYHAILIMDTLLNSKAERLLPFGLSPPIIPYEKGFLIFDKMNSNQNDEIIFVYVSYELETEHQDDSIYSDDENNINDENSFLNNQFELLQKSTNTDFKAFILIQKINTCGNCIDFVLNEVKTLPDELKLATVLIGDYEDYEDNIEKYELADEIGSKVFFVDKPSIQRNFHPWMHLQFISIDEDNQLSSKVYNPSSFNDFFLQLKK